MSHTLTDVYEAIGGLRVEVKTALERLSDQETRVRSLELVRNWCAGVAACAVVLIGFMVKYGPLVAQAVANGG